MKCLKKSTDKKYDIFNCPTIRLGTLSYYRKHPDPEIGDPSESIIESKFIFEKQRIPAALFERMAPGFWSSTNFQWPIVRPFEINMEKLGYSTRGRSGVVLDGDLPVRYTGCDAFLFCVSMAESLTAMPSIGYNHCWFIPFLYRKKFAHELERQLNGLGREWRETLIWRNGHVEEDAYFTGRFSVVCDMVSYQDTRKTYSKFDPVSLREIGFRMKNPDFIKRIMYEHQREFRFSARLTSKRHIIPLAVDCVDLPAEPFRKFCMAREVQMNE